MMTESECQQARELHHRQVQGIAPNNAERALVQTFLQTVSDEDAARRVPYNRQHAEMLAAKNARNQKLAVLFQRQEQLAQSLRDALRQA